MIAQNKLIRLKFMNSENLLNERLCSCLFPVTNIYLHSEGTGRNISDCSVQK